MIAEQPPKSGIHKSWYENGQLKYKQPYKNGKKHGIYKGWYENGQLMYEHPYKNGLKHGTYKGWYENIQTYIYKEWYEHPYKNGLRHGIYKRWYVNGFICTYYWNDVHINFSAFLKELHKEQRYLDLFERIGYILNFFLLKI